MATKYSILVSKRSPLVNRFMVWWIPLRLVYIRFTISTLFDARFFSTWQPRKTCACVHVPTCIYCTRTMYTKYDSILTLVRTTVSFKRVHYNVIFFALGRQNVKCIFEPNRMSTGPRVGIKCFFFKNNRRVDGTRN